MEIPIESILNLIGFLVGLSIGVMSAIGFRNTGSPTLFRLSIAFFAISIGFCIMWIGILVDDLIIKSGHVDKGVQTLSIGIQTIGYFFIAFSHGLKTFLPKSRYFRSVMIFPFFLISSAYVEPLLRSISFILLAYGAIETILSYFDNKRKETILIASGLAMLALGEFLSWYSFVFPEPILYFISNAIKISGLIALFIPVSRIPLTRIKINDEFFDLGDDDPDPAITDK